MKKSFNLDNEQIISSEYSTVMKQSYIDYAMSVIIARALPDIRDGLKPVQRRTLYDMQELGIYYDRPYRKCARIVGDTMGKFHPHGDSSIYEALVVMAQDFKKGEVLIDGHGNFGSIEGDGAAAMRYTEARLTKLAQEVFLQDLDKNIVDFVPNFDETEKEPEVLPVRIPNLLINGTEGIAVGMATSIPPHNLREVIGGTIAYINNPEISLEELMSYIPGPDFPTGGLIINQKDLKEIYETGTGKLKLRGKIEVEKLKGGKCQLVITEIPYTMIGAGIGRFLNDIYHLIEANLTSDILDITNQSSREGIRIVLELKKGADIEALKNLLYSKTRLEDTFGVNILAVADGRPEVLSLLKALSYQVDFQYEITGRKYQTLLERALDKKEIQEGLLKAYDLIDLIIEVIRGSKQIKDAKACLTEGDTSKITFKTKASQTKAKKLSFTPKQAQAILDMKLSKLIGLELEALEEAYQKNLENIAFYSDVLDSKEVMDQVIIKDLEEIMNHYGHERRTMIDNQEEAVYEQNAIEEELVTVLIDRFGYVHTIDQATRQRNEESIQQNFVYDVSLLNTDSLCIFTDQGNLHTLKVLQIPRGRLKDKGVPLDNLSKYQSQSERIISVFAKERLLEQRLLFVTRDGHIKKVEGKEFDTKNKLISATKLQDKDDLVAVLPINEEEFVILQSQLGFFLKFTLEEVSEMKKTAIGVRGMKLGAKDYLTQAYLIKSGKESFGTYGEASVALHRLKVAKRDTKGSKIRK